MKNQNKKQASKLSLKPKSYDQKAAAYWSILKSNPNTSANAIGRRYHRTPLSMRKQDRNDLVKAFKDALDYETRILNSNVLPQTKTKFSKGLLGDGTKTKDIPYYWAKRETRYSLKRRPLAKYEQMRTVRQTIQETFGETALPTDYNIFDQYPTSLNIDDINEGN